MAVTCPECGSDELSLVATLENGRRKLKCEACGNEWLRGEPAAVPVASTSGTATTDEDPAVFMDHDAGYTAWLARNGAGYVLNCYRKPTPDYLILHTAGCHSITELQAQAKTFTGDYIKVCSRRRATLEQWARGNAGSDPTLCRICFG